MHNEYFCHACLIVRFRTRYLTKWFLKNYLWFVLYWPLLNLLSYLTDPTGFFLDLIGCVPCHTIITNLPHVPYLEYLSLVKFTRLVIFVRIFSYIRLFLLKIFNAENRKNLYLISSTLCNKYLLQIQFYKFLLESQNDLNLSVLKYKLTLSGSTFLLISHTLACLLYWSATNDDGDILKPSWMWLGKHNYF